jgi:hypothetical protein
MSFFTPFVFGGGRFCGNQYVKLVESRDITVGSNPKPNLNLLPIRWLTRGTEACEEC